MVMRLLCFRSMVLEPNTPASRISKSSASLSAFGQLRRSPNHVRGQAQIPDPQIHHVPDQALQVHRRQGSPKGRPVQFPAPLPDKEANVTQLPDAYATGQKMLIKVKEQIEEMILKSQGSDRPLPHIPNHAAVETACKPRLRLMSRYGQIAAEAPVQLHPQTGGAPGPHNFPRARPPPGGSSLADGTPPRRGPDPPAELKCPHRRRAAGPAWGTDFYTPHP